MHFQQAITVGRGRSVVSLLPLPYITGYTCISIPKIIMPPLSA